MAMAMAAEDSSRGDDFPTDPLVEILRRLEPNCRRRSRLVCRQWRDAIQERTTTDLRSRAKTLLVGETFALVLDDKWGVKWLMDSPEEEGKSMDVVGTCNGLICLCDDSTPGGAITLANPASGEKLALPPLPCPGNFMRGRSKWHKAYGFAHHQGTGQYKVVRILCCLDGEFHKVQVFTLGEASWRDVTTPAVGCTGVRCLRDAGIVSVDGAVYWVADGTERIMSFDLEKECVTFVKPHPVPLSFRLAEVDGRLGIAISHDSTTLEGEKTDVWVLESARGEQRWRRWYTYSVDMKVQPGPPQKLMLPHFAHANHVLTHASYSECVYSHQPISTQKRPRCGIVHISLGNMGRVALREYVYKAFAYVETKEPLDIYKLW